MIAWPDTGTIGDRWWETGTGVDTGGWKPYIHKFVETIEALTESLRRLIIYWNHLISMAVRPRARVRKPCRGLSRCDKEREYG